MIGEEEEEWRVYMGELAGWLEVLEGWLDVPYGGGCGVHPVRLAG
jgi:hypothetical protein